MGNAKSSMTGYDVQVYNANPATRELAWRKLVRFPVCRCDRGRVKGTYSFFLPSFLHFSGSSVPVDIKAMTTSEAN